VARREIEQSLVAERRLAALFERIWNLSRLETEKVIERGGSAAEIRRAVLGELRKSSVRLQIRAIGRTVEASLRKQLKKLIGVSLPKDLPGLAEYMKTWEAETIAAMRAMLVGARKDAVHLDAWPSLTELAGRARAGGATAAEATRSLGRAAAHAVRRVRSAARSRVLSLGGSANRVVQTALGIERYKWVTRGDGRVRQSHRRLSGTIQRWDRPPRISPGRRGHPGDDYNCRCIAVPVMG
jgi:SPP1 gp7 family putative phage head morphogenesis protein